MNPIGPSWKTTSGGLVAIIGAVASIVTMFSSGHTVDQAQLMTDIGIIASGLGLTFAKDFNVTSGT